MAVRTYGIKREDPGGKAQGERDIERTLPGGKEEQEEVKRVKKPKQKTIQLTEKAIEKIKLDATDKAVAKASLLYMVAMKDEFGYGIDEITKVYVRASRYALYLDSHLAEMEDLAKTLEKDTGITIRWRNT